MNKRTDTYIFALLALLLISFFPIKKKPIKIYLVGDSTMANKEPSAYPETGWGMPFAHFFDPSVTVVNCAKNGRSTKSFIEENLWQPVVNDLNKGDYVLIQFGHNDESPEKVGRYTTPEQFKTNLKKYVDDTRSKKATPILITPVSRGSFDSTGKLVNSHGIYGDLVKQVAKENKVLLIDLQQSSEQLLKQYGLEKSKLLFLHLAPGQHPNYPEGKTDNTHFSELGAQKMAELVSSAIIESKIDLKNRLLKSKLKT